MIDEIEALRTIAFEILFKWAEQESPTDRRRLAAMQCLGDAVQQLDACLTNLSHSKE